MEGRSDATIVVRVWVERADDVPRARIVTLPSEAETTATGFAAIEGAFAAALCASVAATTP